MLNAIKYTRKKIKEGKLEDDKVTEFEEVLSMRDLSVHTGGRRKAITIND